MNPFAPPFRETHLAQLIGACLALAAGSLSHAAPHPGAYAADAIETRADGQLIFENGTHELGAAALESQPHVFRGDSQATLASGEALRGGKQCFYDDSELMVGFDSAIVDGEQLFRDASRLSMEESEINGGVQRFADQSTLALSFDGRITAGKQHFSGKSRLHVNDGSISGGTQHFDGETRLVLTQRSQLRGGRQVFNGNSVLQLGVNPSDTAHLLGGQQIFTDNSKLDVRTGSGGVAGGSIARLGTQQFTDRAELLANANYSIGGGVQRFSGESKLIASATRAIEGGRQFFSGASRLIITSSQAITGGAATFSEQSRLILEAHDALWLNTTLTLHDAATIDLQGHPIGIGALRALSADSRASIVNSGQQDATVTFNRGLGDRQTFFHGGIADGIGDGRISLSSHDSQTLNLIGDKALAYTGSTTVTAGVLALRAIERLDTAQSKTITLEGGWLDVSELDPSIASGFAIAGSTAGQVLLPSDIRAIDVAAGRETTQTASPLLGDKKQGFVKTGDGKLVLSTPNSSVGATRIQAGTLSISAADQLGDYNARRSVVIGDATLELTDDTATPRTIEARGNSTIDVTDKWSSWAGVIQDQAGRTLRKRGTGTLIFAGESHLGGVIIEEGTIKFDEAAFIQASGAVNAIDLRAADGGAFFADSSLRAEAGTVLAASAGKNTVDLETTTVTSASGAAISARQDADLAVRAKGSPIAGSIVARQNAQLTLRASRSDITGDIRADDSAKINLQAEGSEIVGNVIAHGDASIDMELSRDSHLIGTVASDHNAGIRLALQESTTSWTMPASSVLTHLANLGAIQFGSTDLARDASSRSFARMPSDFSTLRVKGNYEGGGRIAMRANFTAEGPLSDRLLIEGDVSGATELDVALAVTKTGKGRQRPSISLVQVVGDAAPDSFKLAGGAIGLPGSAFKHALFAHGPGALPHAAGAAQDPQLAGAMKWDYRLQVAYENPLGEILPPKPDDEDTSVTPKPVVTTPEGNGDIEAPPQTIAPDPLPEPAKPIADPVPPPTKPTQPKTRPKLVAQANAYFSLPRALQNYQDDVANTLHEQLRDVRRGAGQGEQEDPIGYARVLGASHAYRSDVQWISHGVDFDQRTRALQFGGNLLRKQIGDRHYTMGVAGTLGSTHVNTLGIAADRTRMKFNGRDIAITGGVEDRDGFYADAALSFGHYEGRLKSAGIKDGAMPRANSQALSVAAGKPFALANGVLLEPDMQLQYRRMSFQKHVDRHGVQVKIGTAHQLGARAGMRASWPQNGGNWSPYVQAHLLHGWGGAPTAALSGARMATGRAGTAAEISLGAQALGSRTSLHGAVSKRSRLGAAGTSGVSGSMELRYRF